MGKKGLAFIMLGIFWITLSSMLFGQGVWVETTQKDFADGVFEHNIYTSHREYRDPLPGAVEFVQRFDYNNDGWMDVVVSNVGPYAGGPHRENVYVYLQYPGGGFLKGEEYERLSYHTGAAGGTLGADLNTDGYSELIIQNFWYYPTVPDSQGGISIFWGTDSGPDPVNYDSLGPAYMLGACAGVYVADLNKDGWLDLIGGMYPETRDISIFWGSKNGYSEEDIATVKIPEEYAHPTHNFEVADFDKDGHYDILVTGFVMWSDSPTRTRPTWFIYWADSTGEYAEGNFTKFSIDDVQAHGATVADFNNDGWLDIICTTYRSGYRGQPGFTDMDTARAVVYYGLGNREFSEDSTVLRPGYCFGGSAAADLYPRGTPDGWLDLVFFVGNIDEGHAQGPWKEHLWLYYGGANGFSDNRREPLAREMRKWSSSGGLIADFNEDGYQDIFVDDWATQDGYSGVLYGPDFEKIEELPNRTDHHGTIWEVGNIYNRESYEEYISSIYDADTIVNWGKVFAMDSCPQNTYIIMAIRTGNTPTSDNSWSGWYEFPERPSKENNWLCGTVPDTLNSRYIQYKAIFNYSKHDMAGLPVLYEVRIEYKSAGIEESKCSRTCKGKLIIKPSTIEKRTTIEYTIPEQGEILLGVYNTIGKLVYILDKGDKKPGEYKIVWDGKNEYHQRLPSGVYFIRFKTADYSKTRKVILLR